MSAFNLTTNKKDREGFISSSGRNADSSNNAFNAADKAGQSYVSNYFSDGQDYSNFDAETFYKGLNSAQGGGWDNFWKESGDTPDYDFSGDASKLKEGVSGQGIQSDGSIFTKPAWENKGLGNMETLVNAAEQLNLGQDAASERYGQMSDASRGRQAGLFGALPRYQQAMQSASGQLREAQEANSASQYQAITDVLRGNNMSGLRAGQFGTTNATNRLLLNAQIGAAQDRSQLDEAARLEEAKREYTLASQMASAERGIGEQFTNEQFGLRDELEAERQLLANEFAAIVGTTPDQTDHLITLAEEYINQATLMGEIEVKNMEDYRSAILQALNAFQSTPGFLENALTQIQRDIDTLNIEDAGIRGQLEAGVNSLPWLRDVITQLLSHDDYRVWAEEQFGNLGNYIDYLSQLTGGNPLITTKNPITDSKSMTGLEPETPVSSTRTVTDTQSARESAAHNITEVVDPLVDLTSDSTTVNTDLEPVVKT
jgi:hypothetical protein